MIIRYTKGSTSRKAYSQIKRARSRFILKVNFLNNCSKIRYLPITIELEFIKDKANKSVKNVILIILFFE